MLGKNTMAIYKKVHYDANYTVFLGGNGGGAPADQHKVSYFQIRQ